MPIEERFCAPPPACRWWRRCRSGPAQSPDGSEQAAPPPQPPPHVTRILARYVVNAKYDDLPANVRKEGVRTLLNWVGVAIGGSHHQTVDIAVAALAPFSGPPQAGLFGRRERFDIMNAAFINGVSQPYLRLRRHPSEDHHPSRPVRWSRRFWRCAEMQPVIGQGLPQRAGARRRDRMPHRQRRLSQPLRRRLAHHRHRRRVRRGGRGRQAAGAERAADGLGAGPRRLAAGGLARILRLDEQELQSGPRRHQRPVRRASWPRRTSPVPTA